MLLSAILHYNEAVMTGVDYCLHANTDLNNVVQLCLIGVVERRSKSHMLCLFIVIPRHLAFHRIANVNHLSVGAGDVEQL